MKKIIPIVALALPVFAGDPGGYQGFVKAVFTGQAIDITSDVFANAESRVITPVGLYTTALESKTTIAYGGYMKMEGGVIYQFKGCFDDRVAVKIESTWVLSNGSDCQERTGSYTPSVTDWYKIDLRVANNGGAGGCQNASHYGILWKKSDETDWHRFDYDLSLFKTGTMSTQLRVEPCALPQIVSSKMRANDPTVMDITYRVVSDKPTVNVRALAFEDGERSFWKVVRPETFVKDADGNETAQNIGDNIAANVEHKLSWKVSADWKTDLAKVKFEVLTSEMGQLPMKKITIPATAKNPAMTVAYNTQTDADIFNALLWHYADGVDDLINKDGYVDATYGYPNQVDTTPRRLVNRTTLPNRMESLRYVLNKMGWEPLEGGNLLAYVRKATRKDLWYNSGTQNAAILKSTNPKNLYLGEKAYCVIDVSRGQSASSYPVSYLDAEPVGGWSDEYKTTKILLRRVKAGRFMMQKNKEVTLTKPYYIGVFTVTQRQYEQVMGAGTNPTQNDHHGDLRPVEISWNAIRGNSETYNWPAVAAVDPTTFIGRLQKKTGLMFDLPTEAQWECACRAGTSSSFANGGMGVEDLRLLGRAWSVQSVSVGLFVPNLWGVFDMHGNVGEWVLDKAGRLNLDPDLDPTGVESGSDRVFRGYICDAGGGSDASSFRRESGNPASGYFQISAWYSYIGFRLSWTLAE